MFQAFNLFPHMTVMRNVTLAQEKALGRTPAEARAAGDRAARAVRPDRQGGGVPGPALGRPAAAGRDRASARDGPDLLLLDEVTSALDPVLVAEVLDAIRELAAGGMTMVIATHEMGFARDVANRVAFLEEGRILEEGPPEQMFSEPREEATRRFLDRIIAAGRM